MADDFDFLHIKRRTAGSSNELSFDVLDLARAKADSQAARRERGQRPALLGRASKPSYHGVVGTSPLSAAPEVERRKRARRASAVRLWVVVVAVAAVLVGAGTFLGYRYYLEKIDFASRFTLLVDEFVEIDQTLVEMDALMADPLNSAEAPGRLKMMQQMPEMRQRVGKVADGAAELADDARTDDERASTGEVVAAAEAREGLIDAAEATFQLAARADGQVLKANAAWNKVLTADETAREASQLANAADSEDETVAARDKTYEATDLMRDALAAMKELQSDNPGVDLSGVVEYLQTRIDALGFAVDTSTALLANDRDAARSANASYNAAEREAAALVNDLPASIGEDIERLYLDDLDDLASDYQSARTHVTEADSDLRNRL